MAPDPTTPATSAFRLGDGWWVLVVALGFALAIAAWALAPAIFRLVDRPPGDGETVESYEFSLATPAIDLDLVEPAMLHRDMVPDMVDPVVLTMDDINALNAERSTRYLVPSDLVIGVEHNGNARAYPLSVLNVHELVHDELGGDPILVSWHWPSASTRALRRSPNQRFKASGLVAGGNGLLYEPNDGVAPGGELLHSQLLGRVVTGSVADPIYETIPHQYVRWDDWSRRHPDTTAIAPDPNLKKRYKKSSPFTYFEHDRLMFPSLMTTSGPPPKTWVTLVELDGDTKAWSWPWLRANARDGVLDQSIGNRRLRIVVTLDPNTEQVYDTETDRPVNAVHGLWCTVQALKGPLDDALSH